MKKVMTTQETTKENKTYVRPTMEIYPVCVECELPPSTDPNKKPDPKEDNGSGFHIGADDGGNLDDLVEK